jgi:hypothetical protein
MIIIVFKDITIERMIYQTQVQSRRPKQNSVICIKKNENDTNVKFIKRGTSYPSGSNYVNALITLRNTNKSSEIMNSVMLM